MTIQFSCPHCFHRYRVKNALAGQRKKCRQCGRQIEIPGGASPRIPRKLTIRDSVRMRLVQLRMFSEVPGDPAIDANLVADVEDGLHCVLPDEIVAAMASGAEELVEAGIDLSRLWEYSEEAKVMRCPQELFPIGRGPDGHVLYCIPRYSARGAKTGITTFCDEDQSTTYESFPDWLDNLIDGRRCFLADKGSPLAERGPTAAEIEQFQPRLV